MGLGLVTEVCPSLCDQWYLACKSQFFGYEPRTDRLVPCSPDSSAMAVCSTLDQLASSGRGLCEAAGLPVAVEDNRAGGNFSATPSCYSGKQPHLARIARCVCTIM